MTTQILTQEYLKTIFDYKDGVLYWKIPLTKNLTGKKAGSIDAKNYLCTQFQGKKYKNHRLIYMMFHGILPKYIDHIDGNSLNNHIENLREVTHSQNICNAKKQLNNKSGVKGVCWKSANKKWVVQLNVNGKIKHFGYYKDIEYAKFVADAMRYKYHGVFARHN